VVICREDSSKPVQLDSQNRISLVRRRCLLRLANNVANRLNDEFRLVTLDEVSTLFGKSKLAVRRPLREILLKSSPDAVPLCELLFGHPVR
jgi:hypothetical protein